MKAMPVVPVGEGKDMIMNPIPIPVNCPPPVYPMYMVPMMVPISTTMSGGSTMNPNLSNSTNHILTIIQNAYQIFPNNEGVLMMLRTAHEYGLYGQAEKAKEIINEIYYDPARSHGEKEKMRRIMSNMMFLSSLSGMKSPFLDTGYDV